MPTKENEIKRTIKKQLALLSPQLTSIRIASISYNILELVLQLNQIVPGKYRQEILSLSVILDNELAYALELGKDIFIKSTPFITNEQLIEAKETVIKKLTQKLIDIL